MGTQKRLKRFRWKKWFKDTALFASPVIIPVIYAAQGIAEQGIKTGNFAPTEPQLWMLIGSVIQSVSSATLGFFVELGKDKK